MKKYRGLQNKGMLFLLLIVSISALIMAGVLLLLILFGAIPASIMARAWVTPIIVCAGCILGALLASFLMRFYIRPLDDIVAATKRISEGDFSVRVDRKTHVFEIGLLVDNFNSMAKELEGTEMFRSDFINNFSHEFKTPIVSIRGFAKQLQSEDLTDEEKKKYAEIIASESERLSNMATNVLLLSKLENQQLVGEKKPYSLDEQLRDCILLFEKDWEQKNIEMDVELDEIEYNGNEELMSHIWINLIGNAVKYTGDGGRIEIHACIREGNAVVSVSDNGIGMNGDVLEKIFDKFYQGDKSHSERGNGLGLSLVKRIMELCEGSIKVESELSRGTKFTVLLPLSM
ncbi:MAG: HAMP domain-containing histidine kinase [Clostridia bacterium]|nr:HAMP domain-containing histidine kinase [Clostridia bacterium]